MNKQHPERLISAINGLLWLSVESVGTPFFIDVSVWPSREVVQIEIVEVAKSAEPIYLDSSVGRPFSTATILDMEDQLIETIAALQPPIFATQYQEQYA